LSTHVHRNRNTKNTASNANDFAANLLRGLTAHKKRIPSRFFYDARGSALFEKITALADYYPTRVETDILRQYGADIGATLSDVAALVEFGSGSSTKTELLLEQMKDLSAYIAIDVSPSALEDAQQRLKQRFPALSIETIVADFSHVVSLPKRYQHSRKAGYFPGSTIGNFAPDTAVKLLQTFSQTLGEDGQLVIGVDLMKDTAILNQAYNDKEGITAEFNLNVLQRANLEAGANFDVSAFRHRAAYDPETGGVDMYLVSTHAQTVTIDGQTISFAEGEKIHTEHSHKYSRAEFEDVALRAGWQTEQVWTDQDDLFTVFELRAIPPKSRAGLQGV